MRLLKHTASERGLWRAWLANGQSLEVSWATSWRRGWCDLGLRLLIHSNDADQGDRLLNIALGVAQVFIPLGVDQRTFNVGDEPSWGIQISREMGIWLYWGQRRKVIEWPFRTVTLAFDYETADGWVSLLGRRPPREDRPAPLTETVPYIYRPRHGPVQIVDATIHRQRRISSRNLLHCIGWPRRVEYSIDVEFSKGIGEDPDGWKGGCTGCGWTLKPGEEPVTALRRMEAERKFR